VDTYYLIGQIISFILTLEVPTTTLYGSFSIIKIIKILFSDCYFRI